MTSNGTANDAPVAGPSDGTLPPEVRYRARVPQKGVPPQRDARPAVSAPQPSEIGRKRLTTLQLFNLSISMAGAQVAWTVELGYGTPFLLSLGLSEQITSLVWLAGPISGLIAQPLIGAISDSSRSRYRRRFWVATSTGVLCFSTLILAYCQEIAAFFVDAFGGGEGSWDPKRDRQVTDTAIGFAVVAFYFLDFSLNALQASLRNLLLDVTPPSQLNAGNAWHGRMTHAGNIVGYGFGFLPLAQLPFLRLLGGSQFRKFCVLTMFILIVTVGITCIAQDEKARPAELRENKQSKFVDVLRNIWTAIVELPKPIRRVCYVQFFAFMGWFPFLFYATTYVGQVLALDTGKEPDVEAATRMGDLALLWFSIVAVIAGILLPHLARRDQRLLGRDGDEEGTELNRIRDMVQKWRVEAASQGKPLKLPSMPFMLRNIWTAGMLLFTVLTFSTFFISTLAWAIVMVSLVGICWAIACWVPFAIIMEVTVQASTNGPQSRSQTARNHFRNASSPTQHRWRRTDERAPLIRQRSLGPYGEEGETEAARPIAGGTVLGIHNLAIVMPQFIVAVVASAIFKIVDSAEDSTNHNTYLGKSGVGWVLRFGGLCTLVGAFAARMVPPTKTEKEMRRLLGEMKVLREQTTP
ncbi:MFS general substrate transporter [Fomitiporia mediterranea MF3/22]|uniref:MFS general substrate transporter n=1 Tax=Fomitiporia mediterranea (strain MF3/22) TaxID=694068 RepID=UPI0004409A1D|nr:MFS general substrate transporter [Fomitiporia mediterranea MF3/22]EJD01423.1 MFS general substrate transporter [Fomitiporia mediterranea MF3/22]